MTLETDVTADAVSASLDTAVAVTDKTKEIKLLKKQLLKEGVRVISRYKNRKLYDHTARGYIELAPLGKLVTEGVKVAVVDNETGAIFTQEIVLSAILAFAKTKKEVAEKIIASVINLG